LVIRVSIYERVKQQGKWREVRVPIPRINKKDGSLFAKDDRQGLFIICWCEKRKKKRQAVKAGNKRLPLLSEAVAVARNKAWYLSNRQTHPVQDPTTTADRPEIFEATELYLGAKSGCAKTLSAHKLALREFGDFCAREHVAYLDEIKKEHMHRFYEQLVHDGNVPFTAGLKLMRVNQFYKATMHLSPGQGIIKKSDYKRELTVSKVPERYTKAELDALFAHMRPYAHLIFSTLLESGLRKQELMHLEDSDLLVDELKPGVWKCEIRVENKPEWKHMVKTGAARNVLISKEVMDRLLERSGQR